MTKYWTGFVTASLATLLAIFAPAPVARADIFKWEYINPANPGLGKQPSTILCPGGAGAYAVPGAYLGYRNLTMAYLIGANLSGAVTEGASLTNADLSQTNLTGASFSGYAYEWGTYYTDLTGANFTNAQVRGAQFNLSNLTTAQLYSTASYLAHDLSGIGLEFYNLAGANLAGQKLTNADFAGATLTNANFSQANLTNANFTYATLTNANLTGAEVRGASFNRAYLDFPYNDYSGGITLAQLSSTASYQAHDLTGISLGGNDLTGVNLAGQNLTNAYVSGTLTNANFSQANLTSARVSGTLTNANFSQANLTGAGVGGALTGANFTGAEVRGASFSSITKAQLYSTASYQAHDLTGIGLFANNLAGANLAGQNLTNANLVYATLTNADLSQANLTNAYFTAENYFPVANLFGANLSQANLTNANFGGSVICGDSCGTTPGANLNGANLSGADARGANFYLATLDGANTSNLIQSDGHIAGLNLTAGASLVVRDYENYAGVGVPIVVDQHLAMNATGTLRLVFDADHWDSTISFAPGIPVALGGTLELTFAPNVNLASQLGRTIDLFDWTGVNPTGTFNVSSPFTWNLSKLYNTGEVTLTALPAIPGDFNNNGVIDAADYVVWRKTDGTLAAYNAWRSHFGQTAGIGAGVSTNSAVPEPASLVLLMFAAAAWCLQRGRAA